MGEPPLKRPRRHAADLGAEADASASRHPGDAIRVRPVPGLKWPTARPVVKWPSCVECHRLSGFSSLDARIPIDECGLFTECATRHRSCGRHENEIEERPYNVSSGSWRMVAYYVMRSEYRMDFRSRAMKARVAAALSLQAMGIDNKHLMAHIVAMAEE